MAASIVDNCCVVVFLSPHIHYLMECFQQQWWCDNNVKAECYLNKWNSIAVMGGTGTTQAKPGFPGANILSTI